MKCNPGRWVWGLIPVAMLIWLATMGEHSGIQMDLRERAGEQLKAAGVSWAVLGFDGRDGLLAGRASNDDDVRRAVDVVSQVWGVRLLESRAELAKQSALSWSAIRENAAVRLDGQVPSDTVRRQLVELTKAKFPGASVDDRMRVASGDVDGTSWYEGAEFAVGQLGRLASGGRVGLDGDNLFVDGRAETSRDYNLLRGTLAQKLPDGLRLKTERVQPPVVSPYAWNANYSGSQLELTGSVPSDSQRDEILAHAKRVFQNKTIIDRMGAGTGEPANWQIAVMRALTQLAELDRGTLSVTGTNIVMKGQTELEDRAQAIRAALQRDVPKDFKVLDEITFKKPSIPTIKPFLTTVEVAGKGASIAGYAPSEDGRAALIGVLKNATKSTAIDDTTKLGAGADKGWLACLRAGVQGLEKIGGGKLVLRDRNLLLNGQTSNEELIEETVAAVRAAANRACDVEAKIALITLPEPELEWTATRVDDAIVLSGETPDEETRSKILARAKELFPKLALSDTSTVSPAVSAKWPTVALTALDLLAKLRTGQAQIDGQRLKIMGQASDAVTATAIRDALKRDLPYGYAGADNIEVRSDAMLWAEQEAKRKSADEARRKIEAERDADRKREADEERKAKEKAAATERARADAAAATKSLQRDVEKRTSATENGKRKFEVDCRDAMRTTVSKGHVRFARGSAALQKESFATLDRLASVVRNCPGTTIDVEGHADSDGADILNQRLSQRRAAAVVGYLVKAGIEEKRLRAVGYGEKRPLVPNTTSRNKAFNRRIDFAVRVK